MVSHDGRVVSDQPIHRVISTGSSGGGSVVPSARSQPDNRSDIIGRRFLCSAHYSWHGKSKGRLTNGPKDFAIKGDYEMS